MFIRDVRRVNKGVRSVMRGEIRVLNSEMNVFSWLVNGWSEGGSFIWLRFSFFDLLPVTACDKDKC